MRPQQRKTFKLIMMLIMTMGIIGILTGRTLNLNVHENDLLQRLQEKLEAFSEKLPEDRVYLHLDKPLYKPGEDIWYTAYVREGRSMKPSEKSDIVHVELINPKGGVEKSYRLITRDGVAKGDFHLPEQAAGGLYKIKAYTEWQRNDANPAFFEKELTVQAVVLPRLKMKLDFEKKAFGKGDEVIAKLQLEDNANNALSNFQFGYKASLAGNKLLTENGTTDEEGMAYIRFYLPENLQTNDGLLNVMIDYEGLTESISRSIPIVLNSITMQFFPEGGDMVDGLRNNVAFRAVNEYGKPADVEGVVLNKKGEEVAQFSSYHQGMGAFALQPDKDERYIAQITKPRGVEQQYELPEVLPRGYGLHVEPMEGTIRVDILSTEREELSLIATVRDETFYTGAVDAVPGSNMIQIPTNSFPMGVARLTMFDSKGIERAERLVFVNKQRQLNIELKTDKEQYLPREKVKLTVITKDERGVPLPANISLAVVNDQLLSFADDKQGNILSYLLLQPDIKGEIEEPAFYFDEDEPKATAALDYLLMTSGWRRFTWKQVEGDIPAMTYAGEKAVISGMIKGDNGQALAGAVIKTTNQDILVRTDSSGRFTIPNADLTEALAVNISAPDYNAVNYTITEYGNDKVFMLYNNYYRYQVPMQQNMGGRGPEMKLRAMEMQEDAVFMDMEAEVMEMVVEEAAIAPVQEAEALEKEAMAKAEADGMAFNVVDARVVNKIGAVPVQQEAKSQYYRAREFPASVYKDNEPVEIRTDFRSTVYWNGLVQTDRTGKQVLEFYNADDITSYRITAEGIGADGTVGHEEAVYFTQLPFAMDMKVPLEVVAGDKLSVLLILKNNTTKEIKGELRVSYPDGLVPMNRFWEHITLAAGQSETHYLDFDVRQANKEGEFKVTFKAAGLQDAFVQEIKLVPKGFPVAMAFSGQEQDKQYEFGINNLVEGSIQAHFTAYPSVTDELMAGVESILREPYGCFEQTSSSSYPNVMVLRYLEELDDADPATVKRARELLDKGYKRLITFETPEKGYEWFGGAPGHEALTAYGLMQFHEMKQVYDDMDEAMMRRTAKWLLDRRDGNGGFKRNARALDSYGRANEDITNAYIVYALTEAGIYDIAAELNTAVTKAKESKGPYQLGLVVNALYNMKDPRADEMFGLLMTVQDKDGSWTGLTHSITMSTGKSLTIETSSLAMLAMIKAKGSQQALNKAVEYLISSRSPYGGFGSTQGTVMALKALTEYARYAKRTDEAGTIEIYAGNKLIASRNYEAGERDEIIVDGLESYLTSGSNQLRVRYKGVKNPLPYTISVQYNTFLPNSSEDCPVGLSTTLNTTEVKMGETARLTISLTNKKKEGLPMTMAIIGLPAGLTAQPWQLKELQEKQVFDFYEVTGNNVILYYRQMAPSETKEVNLDLKAESPGIYEALASSAYLYYTNEYKMWTKMNRITVN